MRWVQIVAELRELMTFSLRNTNLTFMLYCLCARRRQVSCPRYKIEAHNQHINNLSFRPECPICCQGLYITTTLHWVCSRVLNNFNMVRTCIMISYYVHDVTADKTAPLHTHRLCANRGGLETQISL